jgi:cytidylate kinase
MVIIITGATHTGKTLLAQRMLEEYKYRILVTGTNSGGEAR